MSHRATVISTATGGNKAGPRGPDDPDLELACDGERLSGAEPIEDPYVAYGRRD